MSYRDLLQSLVKNFAIIDIKKLHNSLLTLKKRPDEPYLEFCAKVRRYVLICSELWKENERGAYVDKMCHRLFVENLPKVFKNNVNENEGYAVACLLRRKFLNILLYSYKKDTRLHKRTAGPKKIGCIRLEKGP